MFVSAHANLVLPRGSWQCLTRKYLANHNQEHKIVIIKRKERTRKINSKVKQTILLDWYQNIKERLKHKVRFFGLVALGTSYVGEQA